MSGCRRVSVVEISAGIAGSTGVAVSVGRLVLGASAGAFGAGVGVVHEETALQQDWCLPEVRQLERVWLDMFAKSLGQWGSSP